MKLLLLLLFLFITNAQFVRRPWSVSQKVGWSASLRAQGWSICPRGYLLTGLYRGRCSQLYCITSASCRLPQGAAATRCFMKNVRFNRAGAVSCPTNYFVAGLRRTRCSSLNCINKLYCCTAPRVGRYLGRVRRVRWRPLRRRWSMVPRNSYLVGLRRGGSSSIFSITFARYAYLRSLRVPQARVAAARRPRRPISTWGRRTLTSTKNGWNKCRAGSLLTGLIRTRCKELQCISRLACNRPLRAAGQCFSKSIWRSFDSRGLSSCPRNYYVAGYWKNNCKFIYCIENLYCCTVPGTQYAYRPRRGNWWHSFDKAGLSKVPRNTYITGIWRNTCQWIYCIEYAYYSSMRPCPTLLNRWRRAMTRASFQAQRAWNNCPRGYLLTGFFRRRGCANLSCMNRMRCTRPVRLATKCYIHNVWRSLDGRGRSACAPNYYIAGMWRNRCNRIYCIELFRCCTVPGTKYGRVRTGIWRPTHTGWGAAPRNTYVLGFWRTGCKSSSIYCLTRVYYATMKYNNCPRRGPGVAKPKLGWSLLGGRLINVVAGIRGRLWGVNRGRQIFTKAPFARRWRRISGSLKQIDVGRDGSVCGVNRIDDIWCRRSVSSRWVKIPGKLKVISVLRWGRYYGVNSANRIYKYSGRRWTRLPGSLKQISVGKDGLVCGANSGDYIYCTNYNGRPWIRILGRLKWVSVNDAGEIWGVNRANQIFKGRFDGTPNGAWKRVGGSLTQVDVSYEGLVVGVNSGDRIYAKYPVGYPFRPV